MIILNYLCIFQPKIQKKIGVYVALRSTWRSSPSRSNSSARTISVLLAPTITKFFSRNEEKIGFDSWCFSRESSELWRITWNDSAGRSPPREECVTGGIVGKVRAAAINADLSAIVAHYVLDQHLQSQNHRDFSTKVTIYQEERWHLYCNSQYHVPSLNQHLPGRTSDQGRGLHQAPLGARRRDPELGGGAREAHEGPCPLDRYVREEDEAQLPTAQPEGITEGKLSSMWAMWF